MSAPALSLLYSPRLFSFTHQSRIRGARLVFCSLKGRSNLRQGSRRGQGLPP